MRFTTDRCGNVITDRGLGAVSPAPAGLGLVVSGGGGRGFSSSFAFQPMNWGGWNGSRWGNPYYYYQPDQSCPMALALTAEQAASVRAGQVVSLVAPNQCGQMIAVTVQAAR